LNIDQSTVLALTALLTALVTVVLAGMLYVLKQSKGKSYDEDRHRVELEKMRAYFESQINMLTQRLLSTEDRWKDVNHLVISAMQRSETRDSARAGKAAAIWSPFLENFGLTPADTTVEQDLVFVLTPFHEDFAATYDAIRAACTEAGLRCLRGDETYISGDIFPHILSLIAKARLVIANIDGRNPNVFYELGIAHTLNKPSIVVASSVSETPIDVRTRKIVLFRSKDDLTESLHKELTRTLVARG
jgi:hypothetical protein